MFVNVTTKSAQHAHARMIAIIVENVTTKSGIYKCILYCNRSFWLIVVCFYGFQCNSSAVCESLKGFFCCDLQTAWRLVLSMKPWSYIWLEFGLFSTIIYICIYIYIALIMSSQTVVKWVRDGIWGCLANHLWHFYPQNSNIRRTLVGNKIVDYSDVPTTSSFST